MKIALYIIAGWNVLGALLMIGFIGRPRKPITPASAIVTVVITAAVVAVLILTTGRLR